MADDELPEPNISPPSMRHLPLVWLIPIVVLLVGLFLVIDAELQQGPTIEITFRSAEGLQPGKTKIRYKEVEIGEVVAIHVAPDRRQVIVIAAMHKDAADYLLSDTRFWVVRPRISAGTVSGLGTLFSGDYIGIDVGRASDRRTKFAGLDAPPIVTSDVPGKEFVLHAEEIGSLAVGSPLFYRHIQVGQVIAYALDPGGASVTLKVFVNAPYDAYVTQATYFWQASGVDMSLDADGVRIRTESLAAIIEGGVSFEALPSGPHAPAPIDMTFKLFHDHERAIRPNDTEVRPFIMYFSESLRGLLVGAPVDLRGINIGEVKSISVEYDRDTGVMTFPVEINIFPQRVTERYRMGKDPASLADTSEMGNQVLVDSLVSHGMRAELNTANLLTGQKYISLDFHADSMKSKVDWKQNPPVFPTTTGGLEQIQDTIGRIATKIDRLPFDKITQQLILTMANLDRALRSTDHLVQNVDNNVAPQVSSTLADAQRVMKDADQLLSEESPLQSDLSAMLLQLTRATKSVNALADYLERHPESLIRGKTP